MSWLVDTRPIGWLRLRHEVGDWPTQAGHFNFISSQQNLVMGGGGGGDYSADEKYNATEKVLKWSPLAPTRPHQAPLQKETIRHRQKLTDSVWTGWDWLVPSCMQEQNRQIHQVKLERPSVLPQL